MLRGTAFEEVPLLGMVKDDRHRTRGLINGAGSEIVLSMHRGPFAFITSIQDEAHRWANDYRKRMHKSKSYSSTLEKVQGVRPGYGQGADGAL